MARLYTFPSYPALCAVTALLCFALVAPARAQFETRANRVTNGTVYSEAVGDFNSDGKLDVAVIDGGSLSVLLGNGDGTFQSPVNYSYSGLATAIVAADFNGDGKLDLAVTDYADSVSVLLGNGDGTFRAPITSPTTNPPVFLAVGDFNGDHKLDLVVIDNPYISVLLGNGDGTFQPLSDNNSFVGARAVAVGDFNNDDVLDVVAVGSFGTSSNVGVLLGNGNGTLQSSLTYPLANTPGTVAVGYFDADSNADIAIGGLGNQMAVMLGKGDGSFGTPEIYKTLGGSNVVVADFNGDGIQDLGGMNAGLPKPGANELLGRGDGTFLPSQFFPAGNALSSLAVGDFNGDHKPDLVLGDNLYGAITLLNTGVVKFSPTTPLNFPVQLINTKSVAQSTTLTNSGATALSIRSFKVTGAFQSSNDCRGRVAAGGSCKITATFQPKTLGSLSGLVTINDSASSEPQVVELLGQATALQLSPTALNFGDQKVGTASAPQEIVVTNRSGVSITLTSWGIGIDGSEFSETDNCKSRLAASASCTMTITFTPQKTGPRSGTAYVDVGQGANPPFVPLSGTGTD